MIRLRLAFYGLYILLGAVILVRLLYGGFRWESLGGIVLALALIALGIYRIRLYLRISASGRR